MKQVAKCDHPQQTVIKYSDATNMRRCLSCGASTQAIGTEPARLPIEYEWVKDES